MIKTTNLSDMVLNLRCNTCGNQIKIYPKEECVCKICHNQLDLSLCENIDATIQSEFYYLYQLKAGIINKDDNMIKQNMGYLDQYGSENPIYLYMKNKSTIKNILDREALDFIIEYDIIQNNNYSRDEKIKIIRKTKYKDVYLARIKDETVNEELKDKLFQENYIVESYDEMFDIQTGIGILLVINSIVLSVFIAVLSKFILPIDVLYASEIIICIIPAIIFTIGIEKITKTKNKILATLKFICVLVLSFVLISYTCTIFLNNSISESFNNYLYHLTHCFSEIYEAIFANYEGV